MAGPVVVDSRRKSEATLRRLHGAEARLIDVTSRGEEPWVRFSPFFPHGAIPIPGAPGAFAESVEGIWQGLKCFERAGVDPSKFANRTGRDLKRTTRKHGAVRGHRYGLDGPLLPYVEARERIYLPAYRFILEQRLAGPLQELCQLVAAGPVVLLDYETNGDVKDTRSPLSHASLVAAYLEGRWPGPSAHPKAAR